MGTPGPVAEVARPVASRESEFGPSSGQMTTPDEGTFPSAEPPKSTSHRSPAKEARAVEPVTASSRRRISSRTLSTSSIGSRVCNASANILAGVSSMASSAQETSDKGAVPKILDMALTTDAEKVPTKLSAAMPRHEGSDASALRLRTANARSWTASDSTSNAASQAVRTALR
ncbi:hypothetical protein D3C73_1110370 [compost metagenome]